MAAVPSRGRASRVEAIPAEAVATRALYERYAAQIQSYCLHQLGSREEAEDAVQSTFLNAFRGLSRGIVPEAECAWLYKIAENVCLSRRRSSWRRGRVETPADFDVVADLTPAPSRRADELIGLQDVLEQMPEMQRRAILLREWQGLSYREIGDELELSQAAVETLIFRARRSLAQGLEASPVEHRSWRQRVRSSVDVGSLVGGIKTLLASGAAVKMGTAAAVVAVSSVAAAPALDKHVSRPSLRVPPARTHVVRTKHVVVAPVHVATAAPAVVHHAVVARHHHARVLVPLRKHVRPVAAAPAPAAASQATPESALENAPPPAPAPAAPALQDQPAAAVQQPVAHDNGNHSADKPAAKEDKQNKTPPGQEKKQAAAAAPAAPVQQQPAAVQTTASVAAPAPVAADASSPGHGRGNAYGHDKDKKSK